MAWRNGLRGRVDVIPQVDDADDDDAVSQTRGNEDEPVQPFVEVHEQEKGNAEDGLEGGQKDDAELVLPLRLLNALQGSGPHAVEIRRFGDDGLLTISRTIMPSPPRSRGIRARRG